LITTATSKFDTDESSKSSSISSPKVKGLLAFMLWRAAYWTKQVSLQNKMLILMYWFKSAVFGRDVSRF
jgi:NADH dehydrogenase FAD-containing subunit